jgi:hypothetical protein
VKEQLTMAARQSELFDKPAPRRRGVIAHVVDAGHGCGGNGRFVQFGCRICDWRSEWTTMSTVTEARRGIPCEKCNSKS